MDEQYENIVMECTNCKLKFFISELKLDPKSDTMVCKNCLDTPIRSKVLVIRDRPPKKVYFE